MGITDEDQFGRDSRNTKFAEVLADIRMMESPTGADGRYIGDTLIPEFYEQFLAKAKDYNDNQNENHRVLGVRGQFADIWRKIGKLKKALWEGHPLVGEQPREILMDLIAHCFLTISMMDEEGSGYEGTAYAQGHMRTVEPTKARPVRDWRTAEQPQLWPQCGRERCVVHPKVPLAELRAAGIVKIQPGEPREGSVLPAIRGIDQPQVVYCHA
jgi:hypothetical protein